jgi:hypothetical protein
MIKNEPSFAGKREDLENKENYEADTPVQTYAHTHLGYAMANYKAGQSL